MGRGLPSRLPSSRRPAAGPAWQGMTGSHTKMMRDETGQDRGMNITNACSPPVQSSNGSADHAGVISVAHSFADAIAARSGSSAMCLP